MAITVRATTTGSNVNSTSTTISLPAGTTTGDVTIATFIHAQTAGSAGSGGYASLDILTPPSGWNVLVNCGGWLVCWRAYQAGDPASITATSGVSQWWISACISYAGADTAAPIDAFNFHYAHSNNTYTYTAMNNRFRAPSINPNYNGSQLLAIYAEGDISGHAIALPGGMTSRVATAPGPNLLLCDKTLTDGTPTGNLDTTSVANNTLHAGIQIAIKAAGASGATLAAAMPVLSGMMNEDLLVTSYTLPLAKINVQDGDMVAFFVTNVDGSVNSAPTGWDMQVNGVESVYTGVWKTGDTKAPVFGFTGSGHRNFDTWLIRKVGQSANGVIVEKSGNSTASGSGAVTVSAPSLTPTSSNGLLACHFGVDGNNAGTWSGATAGLTDEDAILFPGSRLSWRRATGSPTGAYSATWTRTGANNISASSLLFSVGAVGGSAAAVRPQVFVCT